MAYRKIHDDFWTDPDMEELTPEQKFFYLYLITNPSVNQIGLYEFSVKRACFETGYNNDTVYKLLEYFESAGKIVRSSSTKEILIVKFYWHNKSESPKVKTHVKQLLESVKDTSLIQYIYGMYTQTQEEEEKEEEEYVIPSLHEVKVYFKENGYSIESAEKAYNYYHESVKGTKKRMWRDGRGQPIKNWKMKMRSVWFKDENKIQQNTPPPGFPTS